MIGAFVLKARYAAPFFNSAMRPSCVRVPSGVNHDDLAALQRFFGNDDAAQRVAFSVDGDGASDAKT
jgi:hypothetical protein